MNIKTVLLAMFNTTNEIGYWTMRERNFNIIPYIRKQVRCLSRFTRLYWLCIRIFYTNDQLPCMQWVYLCKAILKEAKWYHSGYKPTTEEYFENAPVSIGAPLALFCAYFLTAEQITVEALDYIDKLPSIMWCPSLIVRLTNDLGTSSVSLQYTDLNSILCKYIPKFNII